MDDLVSVIIPCYNREHFIAEAIRSALDQTHPAVEVIVVDDGSTDASWSIIEGFGERVRAIRIENGGASRARNHGITMARGRHLKFLDSDDLLPREALAEMVAASRNLPEKAFVVGQASSIDADGRPLALDKYNYRNLQPGGGVPRIVLLSQPTSVSMPLFPRAAVADVGGFREDLILAEDYELMLRLHYASWRAHYVAIASALVREHDLDRITTDQKPEAFMRAHAMYADILRSFEHRSDAPLTADERTGLGQLIWVMARRAAQLGFFTEASRLFGQAYGLAGNRAFVARFPMSMLYHCLKPVTAERMAMVVKSALRPG